MTLGKEARRWSTKIAREVSCIRENNRKLQVLYQLKEAGQKVRVIGRPKKKVVVSNMIIIFYFH